MRLAELYGARVRTRDGESVGRVREVLCKDGKVSWLGVGAGTLLQRLTGGRHGRRIAWDKVVEIGPGEVTVED